MRYTIFEDACLSGGNDQQEVCEDDDAQIVQLAAANDVDGVNGCADVIPLGFCAYTEVAGVCCETCSTYVPDLPDCSTCADEFQSISDGNGCYYIQQGDWKTVADFIPDNCGLCGEEVKRHIISSDQQNTSKRDIEKSHQNRFSIYIILFLQCSTKRHNALNLSNILSDSFVDVSKYRYRSV